MSENQIRQSGAIFKQILSVLQKFQEQIVSALNHLKELPDLIKNVLDSINESASRQIQARGEMEIIIKLSNLRSKKHLISSENEAIEDFKRQLDQDVRYVKERFEKINVELNQESRKRVRELDEHLLQLPNKFPKKFIKGYQEDVSPLLLQLKENNEESQKNRESILMDITDKLCKELNVFTSARKAFFDQIEDFKQDMKTSEYQKFELPVWMIHSDKPHFLLPGKITITEKLSAQYEPQERLRSYHGNIQNNLTAITPDRKSANQKNGSLRKAEMQTVLLDYLQQNFPNYNSHTKRAIKKILEDSELS